jgi:hypothetical protein
MNLPERISAEWIGKLTDLDLIDVEAQLREQFAALERRERELKGSRYDLFRSPPAVMDAWDRWSRVLTATRSRSLTPRRRK